MREFHACYGIITQAWSPFGSGGRGGVPLLDDETIVAIAKRHKRTPSQAVLRWMRQSGIAAIPKATSKAHLIENLSSFDFDLDEADLAAIAALDSPDGRYGPHPAEMSVINMRGW